MTFKPLVKERLFCPGPTSTSLNVKMASMMESPYHRTEEFYTSFLKCRKALAPCTGSKEEPMILTCSGSGAMEAAVVNLTAERDEVLVLDAGKFGERWIQLTSQYKCQTHIVKVPAGEVPRVEAVQKMLQAHPRIKAVFFQGTETSTGVTLPVKEISEVVRRHSDALVVVDGISYLLTHPMEMDAWGIDALVFATQKAFALPPGLAFITLSQRAWQRISSRPRFYFDLVAESKGQAKGRTVCTPNIPLIKALEVALVELHNFGIDAMIEHHGRLARAVRCGITALGLELFAKEHFANAVTAIRIPSGMKSSAIMTVLRKDLGAIFAEGQEDLKEQLFRLGHLGQCDRLDIASGIAALELALASLKYKFNFGTGVGAFLADLMV